MKKQGLSTTGLRVILSISLFVIVGIGISLIYIGSQKLNAVAAEVSQANVNAKAGSDTLAALQNIQKQLIADQPAMQKANELIANGTDYAYQDQVIQDLSIYAQQTGITITGTDFPATASPSVTATPVPSTPGSAPVSSPTVAGVTSTSITVSIATPVGYTNLLEFIRLIESNQTKMQLQGINVTAGTGGSVTTGPLTIQLYVN